MKKAISIIAFVLPLLVIATVLAFVNATWLTETSQLHGHEVSAEMSNRAAVILMIAPAMLALSYASSLFAKRIYVTKFERAL